MEPPSGAAPGDVRARRRRRFRARCRMRHWCAVVRDRRHGAVGTGDRRRSLRRLCARRAGARARRSHAVSRWRCPGARVSGRQFRQNPVARRDELRPGSRARSRRDDPRHPPRAASSPPRYGTTARAWKCCARSGTKPSRSMERALPGTSATCRCAGKASWTTLWRAGGLERVEEQPIEIEMPFASFDDYWLPFLGGQGPAGAHAAGLTDTARSALEARLRARLLGGRHDRAFTLRARAWAVRGVVAG